MIDNFSLVISNAKEKGKLVYRNLGFKSISKNNIQLPFNDIFYIDLSGNKLTVIPDIIKDFYCLEVLLCSHNMIRCLPSDISNLSFLETLDLSCNHLTSLHSAVCKLQSLKVLVISSNRLVSLPGNIGRLASLEELDSSCNSLTCLPEELSNLNKLRYLNLRHNKLLDVPINLHKLNLEVLDLSENQLTYIPSEYHRITTLQSLNLSGNPLNFPPANVCIRGLQHVMKYLQSESKHQLSKNAMNLSAQSSVDYSTINNCFKSKVVPCEINAADSITVTSTNSQYSTTDFDFDQDSNDHEEDTRPYKYVPTNGEDIACNSFTRNDSGYNTITDRTKQYVSSHNPSDKNSLLPEVISNSNINCLYSDNKSSPALNTVEETVQISNNVIEGQYKKNKTTPSASPAIYRSSRYVSKNTIIDNGKSRRNSVPSKEKPAQTNTVVTQEAEQSSQCVVLVDNSRNESRKSSSNSIHNQSNNNNSSRFIKNVPLSPTRVIKSKLPPHNNDRQNSVTSDKILLKSSLSQMTDTNNKIQEKISKFHKIVEAQLHVHINSKKLSEELSNGIYLCHLANILIPHSIPTVHTPSPGQRELGKQKSKRNLDNFLEACRRNGVQENCLFNARDVLSCNPIGLLNMAQAVEALIESIRIKNTRLSASRATSSLSSYSTNSIDWQGILNNPLTLSNRRIIPGPSRSSLQGCHTIDRPAKLNIHKTAINSKLPNEDIIQYSSEV